MARAGADFMPIRLGARRTTDSLGLAQYRLALSSPREQQKSVLGEIDPEDDPAHGFPFTIDRLRLEIDHGSLRYHRLSPASRNESSPFIRWPETLTQQVGIES